MHDWRNTDTSLAGRARFLPTMIAVALSSSLAASVMAAEVTVLTAAKIHTMNPEQPRAQALAYDAEGTILAVGGRDA
ncbi:MAG: hypothetical protein H0T88_08905, partial [Lysobacter sp.]|nr:hypothetical protein [Lysobacter sp.]